eukprot:14551142-Ditylum_brightwellii.AAC.1
MSCSPKMFGGTRSRTQAKLIRMIGMGLSNLWGRIQNQYPAGSMHTKDPKSSRFEGLRRCSDDSSTSNSDK